MQYFVQILHQIIHIEKIVGGWGCSVENDIKGKGQGIQLQQGKKNMLYFLYMITVYKANFCMAKLSKKVYFNGSSFGNNVNVWMSELLSQPWLTVVGFDTITALNYSSKPRQKL